MPPQSIQRCSIPLSYAVYLTSRVAFAHVVLYCSIAICNQTNVEASGRTLWVCRFSVTLLRKSHVVRTSLVVMVQHSFNVATSVFFLNRCHVIIMSHFFGQVGHFSEIDSRILILQQTNKHCTSNRFTPLKHVRAGTTGIWYAGHCRRRFSRSSGR